MCSLNRVLLAGVLCIGLAAPALAESMTLTNAEVLDLQAGLREIAGLHQVITKNGGNENIANVPYKLKAAVVDQIARNILALKPINDALEMTRNSLQQQAVVDEEGRARDDKTKAEEMRKAEEGFRKLLLERRTVDLVRIDPKELGREEPVNNPIPALVMAQLSPILGREAEAKK